MDGTEKTEWQMKIDEAYLTWKKNDLHKNIKCYFSEWKSKSGIPDGLKLNSNDEQSCIGTEIENLKKTFSSSDDTDEIDNFVIKEEHKKPLFIRDSSQNVTFLGSKIAVAETEASDSELDTYCKETVFSGFWKTLKKLANSAYRMLKSGLDVLKKLFKKVVDFLEAGMQSIVVSIGHTIAKIVSLAFPIPDYKMHDELDVLYIENLPFENAEQCVQNKPQMTFFPKTVEEISMVIQHAKSNGKRLRCAGMKHSWTDLFSNDGEYLMCLLPLEVTDHLTFARVGVEGAVAEIEKWGSEFTGIELIEILEEGEHAAVRVGAGATNLQMLEWSQKSGWTMPMNIIALMISYGGANATITHGAGINNKNLNDIVIKIEFVNALGQLQIVDDPELLKSISGAFGLMGVVTAIIFKMDKMTYAKYHPKKTLMADSIPAPGTDPSDPAFQKMVDLCQNHYYTEFFWFPNWGADDGYWENCWKNDGDPNDAVDLNDDLDDQFQTATTYLFDITTSILQPLVMVSRNEHYDDDITFKEIVRHIFTKIVSFTGHDALPQPKEPITTALVEALHFRTGFHYIMVREMEMQIPIPSLPDGGPDFSIVSKAWWDAVDLIQKSGNDKVFACDMALELRIMGGSDVTMAPQHGNKHGTLCIEPVSTRMVHKEVWEDFKDQLAKVWMSYTDFDGTPLNTRLHWAKEAPRYLEVEGVQYETMDYVHKNYENPMRTFFDDLNELTEGVSIQDLNDLFSNRYLDRVFRPQWERFQVSQPKKHNGYSNNHNINQDQVKPGGCSEFCNVL